MSKKILIVIGFFVLSACGVYSTQSSSSPSPDDVQPGVQIIPTVDVIRTAMMDDNLAYNILVQFFDHLHAGRYEEAVTLYDGDYQLLIDQNPEIDPADHARLMKNACTTNGFRCLRIKLAGIDWKNSPNEYVFTVQFQNDDGSLFVLGPCCGASETEQPPVSFFEIRVLKIAEGEFRVLDMPPYMP